jgi:hypothetical protein
LKLFPVVKEVVKRLAGNENAIFEEKVVETDR